MSARDAAGETPPGTKFSGSEPVELFFSSRNAPKASKYGVNQSVTWSLLVKKGGLWDTTVQIVLDQKTFCLFRSTDTEGDSFHKC